MSVQAQSWALRQRIVTDPTARHVLLCLANYAGPEGEGAFPSVATLCDDTGLSPRTVQSKLRDLEELEVIRRGNQELVRAHIRRADLRPVCYDIDLSRGANPAPRVEHPEDAERGAAAAPRVERGANDDATGCISRPNGVQMTTERGAGAAPDPSINKNITINKPKGARERSPSGGGFDPRAIELPDWLPAEDWQRWCRHRSQLGKRLTELAVQQQLKDMHDCVQRGWKPKDMIDVSIGRGWQGLFSPKGNPADGGANQSPQSRGGRFDPLQHMNRDRNQGSRYDDDRTVDV
ncbi:Primosomal protein I [plant metagenome]|uniref:Primosomal protein I n=1 Tax=plant metagenome TaxID=1297885 RepID=A0A484VE89_9ZZZZ